jgi:hypothetical protein
LPVPSGWLEASSFAAAAAVVIELARLAAGFPATTPTWFARNLEPVRVAVPRRVLRAPRQLDAAAGSLTAAPFVLARS